MEQDQETGDMPSVDELEGRLNDVESAMNQLQAGELDSAEAAIDTLAGQVEGSTAS